jgi:hypothetical protein
MQMENQICLQGVFSLLLFRAHASLKKTSVLAVAFVINRPSNIIVVGQHTIYDKSYCNCLYIYLFNGEVCGCVILSL